MTLDHLGFKYLSAAQIEAVQIVAAEFMKRIEYAPGAEPSHEILLAALAEVFANIAGSAVETRAVDWDDFVRPVISDIRTHVISCAPKQPQSGLTQEGLTVNQANFMRALLKYPDGTTLDTIESVTKLNRRSLHSGATSAMREGYVTRTSVKHSIHYYSLTEEGRLAMERLDQRRLSLLPLRPHVHTRVPRSHRPTGPRLKSSS